MTTTEQDHQDFETRRLAAIAIVRAVHHRAWDDFDAVIDDDPREVRRQLFMVAWQAIWLAKLLVQQAKFHGCTVDGLLDAMAEPDERGAAT